MKFLNKILLFSFITLFLAIPAFADTAQGDNYAVIQQKGFDAYNDGNYAAAVQYLTSIPKSHHTLDMVICIANSYESLGDTRAAVLLLESLNKSNVNNYSAFYNLGNIYLKAKVYKNAIETYKLCTRLNTRFAPAYYNLGISYYNTNQLSKAYYAFKDAIRLNPNNINAYYNLGVCCERMGQNKEAEKYFEKVKSVEGENFKK